MGQIFLENKYFRSAMKIHEWLEIFMHAEPFYNQELQTLNDRWIKGMD